MRQVVLFGACLRLPVTGALQKVHRRSSEALLGEALMHLLDFFPLGLKGTKRLCK